MSKSVKYNTPYDRDMANIARKKYNKQPQNESKSLLAIVMVPFIVAGFAVAPPMGFAMLVTFLFILASGKL